MFRIKMLFNFSVGDIIRVYYISVREGFLKRLVFEGCCISKINKDIGSSFCVRTNYLGFEINQKFCTFGSNIFTILCLQKNIFKKRYSKLYFLKKKTYV